MINKKYFSLSISYFALIFSVCFGCFTPALRGQGIIADYNRGENLRALTHNKVFNNEVQAHWSNDGVHFWYRNQNGPNQFQFILVDAETGVRKPAFDETRMADALSKISKTKISSNDLPIEWINYTKNELKILAFGKWWLWDKNGNLQQSKITEDSSHISLTQQKIHPSQEHDNPSFVNIVFVNQTSKKLTLKWIDLNGYLKSYGDIAPGESKIQNTRSGDFWTASDANGNLMGTIEAPKNGGIALFDENQANPRKNDAQKSENKIVDKTPYGPVSPDGHWVASFKDYNVQIRNVKLNQSFMLTNDGTENDSYSGAFYWSPDSRKLVVLKTKQGDRRKLTLTEAAPADQLQPKIHIYDYPKAGDRIDISKPHLFLFDSKKELPISDALFQNPWSLNPMEWEPNSNRFIFCYNQRGHQIMRVLAVDANSGNVKAIVDENSDPFFDFAYKFFFYNLSATHEMIWMSERSGWNHLYLYDSLTGKVKNPITKGEWVVRGVDWVDEKKRQIWFHAGGIYLDQDPYYIQYGRVNFDGSGLVMLTKENGTHTISYSPNHLYYVDTWSRVDLPPVSVLKRSSDGTEICVLERGNWDALLATGWKAPEPFVAKGRDGKTNIYGVIFRPTNLDPTKKYPIIEDIYAGPHEYHVPKSFYSLFRDQELAEIGFVVVVIDGMGTNFRSRAFHDVSWKNLLDAGFPDRILWIKAAAKKYPYMDINRVGIYGGSAGGQNAVDALITHNDFYKVAVADSGCYDNRMDKMWWSEMWMGWPVGPDYAAQSAVTLAPKLKGKLFLMVGGLDNNVDPSTTFQLVNALIKANKDFSLLEFPEGGHCAGLSSAYGWRRLEDFFVQNLLGVQPRAQ